MATWTDVTAIMRSLPVAERDPAKRQWRVSDRLAAWERPLRKSDLEALGPKAPEGPILGVRVPLEVKEAMIASKKKAYFTTPHFDGYPAILVHLPSIRVPELRQLLKSACDEKSVKTVRAQRALRGRRKG
jgi:hypothetical protein